MRTIMEKLGLLSKILNKLGIDPRYPAHLITPRLYTLAPRLAAKLADAS
ncbi:MAG: hypothetical protein LM562_02590 [Pyrobaculum sp.]|nr:hypothetical protein [Pyrobaculum sp.]